ncbi:hypothetical protein NW768_006550 [Fusarium equiseti]|uniref:Amidase domain-containing protein n=1 Tax=Fusarium equiseti TaxID=61235 RepID=A0ABQ8RBX2_FUSEQ|nr:hypothetical protein NW768_006550 [Fusarium equiseti]
MVRILKDAGAVPYVKTNVPITLLSFESLNDVWGETSNPYNKEYTAGGSTGGEGALLALGGRIGIGSDVAGSVGCPAHFSGCYALKCSTGRWLKTGVVTSMPGQDGVPAVYRESGHEIIEIDPPSPYEALRLASILLCSDGLQTVKSFFSTGESNDQGAAQMTFYFNLPRPIKYLHYLWVKHVRRDDIWAGLLRNWHPQSGYEIWQLNAKQELYKRRWYDWWSNAEIDCIIAPPNATPAVPHKGMHGACSSCGYTFMFNLLDYTAGVLPVTHDDKSQDQLPKDFNFKSLNGVAQGAYKLYDATAMHGLPVGVQVIGRRLEEKVLAIMKRVEDALGDERFPLLELD